MPKAEKGTPKWLANQMKAKGLQRLRWYCQMCEKQCRDENGFKCHQMSEQHQRMMQVFAQNPGRFMSSYSSEFEASFMQLMRTRYRATRVLANIVYQEVISDKQHIHMNATIWNTLGGFVVYLGRTNKCKIEKCERGWYLEYVDQEKLDGIRKRHEREEKDARDEEAAQRIMLDRTRQAREEAIRRGEETSFLEPTKLERKGDDLIQLNIKAVKKEEVKTEEKVERKRRNIFEEDSEDEQDEGFRGKAESSKFQGNSFFDDELPSFSAKRTKIEEKKRDFPHKSEFLKEENQVFESEAGGWLDSSEILAGAAIEKMEEDEVREEETRRWEQGRERRGEKKVKEEDPYKKLKKEKKKKKEKGGGGGAITIIDDDF